MLRLRDRGRFLLGWLLSALIGFGLLWPLLDLLRFGEEAGRALVIVLMCTLADALARRLRRPKRAIARAALLTILAALSLRDVLSFAGALTHTPFFQTAALFHSDALVLVFAALMSAFGLLLAGGDAAFGAPLILTATMMLWMSGARAELTHYLPAALSVPLLFVYARPYSEVALPKPVNAGGAWRRALPAAVATVLLALLLTPAQRTTYAPMEKKADELRQLINDYFFFTDSRQAFSLRGEGWQPMGDEGLGGVPQVPDTPVMEVAVEGKTYLRGSIRDMYNGRGWYDTISKDRYGYNSPRFMALRQELTDANLPEDSAFPLKTAQVHILRDSTSTLFVPQRIRELIPQGGLVPYFNAASEIFVTRNLKAGDRYTVRFEDYTAGDSVRLLARSLENRPDARYEDIKAQYTLLPDHLAGDGVVADLARRYAGGATSPYEMAENIMLALRKNYQYTLDVPPTPTDIDFVAHFLFQSKMGYCTYFASAMVVLARSVGLPARYIEGFVADGGSKTQTLTSRDAHAWAEIYIPAVGWVVFDATAPEGEQGQSDQGSGDQGGQPEETPQPTSTPQPTEGPEQADSSPPPTQEPQPSEQPSPAPSSSPDEEEKPLPEGAPPFPWWLIAILLLALLAWRAVAVAPTQREKKERDAARRLLLWWQAFARVNAAGGRPMAASETMEEYARRLAPADEELARLAADVSAVVYGGKQMDAQTAARMRARCRAALVALPLHRRAGYYAKRLLPAPGEIGQALAALRQIVLRR